MAPAPEGRGRIGTFTVTYAKGVPEQAIVIGEMLSGGRFIAASREPETVTAMTEVDPLGREVSVTPSEKRNSFTFA